MNGEVMYKQFDGTDVDVLQEDTRLEGFAMDQELAHEDPQDFETPAGRGKQLIALIPKEQHAVLAAAHDRYMYFAGVYTDTNPDFSAEQIAEDRTRFAHLLAFTGDGCPSLSDERCAEFMSAITGLPRDWCIAWDEMEFIETHGEDFIEKQLRRQESERLVAQCEGVPE